MKNYLTAGALALLTVAVATSASAHTLRIGCHSEGADKIVCEGAYSDGKLAAAGDIKVVTEKGVVLVSGKTDAKGVYSFAKPKGEYAVVLQTGPQHMTNLSSADIK